MKTPRIALLAPLFASLLPLFADGAAAAPQPDPGEVRVGIVYYTRPSRNEIVIPPTIKAIEDKVGAERVVVKRYTLVDLAAAIRSNEVDVFLASSGFYRLMVQHGARDLATLASLESPNPSKNDGSAIVVRADSSIRTLMDASGARLGASSPTAFLGYLAGLGEVARQGADPDRFFSKTNFYGGDDGAIGILKAMRDGDIDVGIFRRCWLEDFERAHPAEAGKYRVLDARPESGRCARSTDLYPTWTIATAPGIRPEASRLVASAVLGMAPTSDGIYWGVASDYRKIDELYKRLRTGPYAYLRDWSVKRFLSEFWPGIAIAVLLVLGLIGHSVRVEDLVKKRTAQLQEALRIQKAYQDRVREASQKISSMEKIGIIGQLCSVFAHEMRQPLGAIALYAQGMKSLVRNGRATGPQLTKAIERIEEQARRASGIVDRVRAYTRSRDAERKPFSLNDAVARALSNFEASAGHSVRVLVTEADQVSMVGDSLELELAAYNLIKNAAEAVKGMPDGLVEVVVARSGSGALLSVSDNGPIPSPEAMAQLANPVAQFKSKKEGGLGLGLLIVRTIIEKNGGRLTYEAGRNRGVTAWAFLPCGDAAKEPGAKEEGAADTGPLPGGPDPSGGLPGPEKPQEETQERQEKQQGAAP